MAFLLFHNAAGSASHQQISRRRACKLLVSKIREKHLLFWSRYPALLAGLSLVVGTSALLFWGHVIWPILWSLYLLFCRFIPQIALTAAALFYGWFYLPPTALPTETIALFSPSSLQPHQSPFAKGLLYKGTLFLDRTSIPCSICYNKDDHPLANCDYVVSGQLNQRGPYDYSFKPKTWKPVSSSWSLAEFRYQSKESFRKFLKEQLPSPRVASLLGSLTTGDVEDRLLRYEFGRLGLQHILAISGFHFGILIAFSTFCLNLFLSRNQRIIALFFAVTLYFVFVGSTPAVQRSWLTTLLYLLAQFLGRPTSGLNLLGCAMTIELILNPIASGNLGFQLSFLSCAGILLFHSPLDRTLQKFLPKRTLSDARLLPPLSKLIYLLSSFFRQAMSLTLSVNLPLLPLLLYQFHQFPLLGLLYNLFFPFLIGLGLFLLLLSLIFHLLFPPLASLLFWGADWFTSQLLQLTAFPPLPLDYSIYCTTLPAAALPPLLFLLLVFRIHLTTRPSFV